MPEFRMPSLGADMDAGTLVQWRVKPGDRVRRGDIVADVETQKGIIEVECFEEGVVAEILVQPDEKVPVGTVLAVLKTEGVPAVAAVAAPVPAAVAAPVGAAVAAPPPLVKPPPVPERHLRVSPLARKLAESLGVDLNTVTPDAEGHIGRVEIERAAAGTKQPPPKAALPPTPTVPPLVIPTPPPAVPVAEPVEAPPAEAKARAADFQAGMRAAIAAAMARSNRDIPHYYLQMRIDMSRALHWLEAENLRRSMKDRLLPAVLLIKACAKALVAVPELNGYYLQDRFQPSEAIHIGFAISLRQGGLIAPAIHDADEKNLDELMEAMRDLITRTRAGRLRSSEMSDATITLTNLGDMGVETVYGVIYPPQVALVGFGKVIEQPWAEGGMLGIRPVVTATLAADHRASDGARGANFLNALDHALQEPEKL